MATGHPHEPEAAFERLTEGLGRRDFLRAATAIGAGAIAPAWMLSPGVEDAAAAADGPGPRVLQSGRGQRAGHYVESTPETVQWGFLPNRDARPIRTVTSGSLVTFDTVSHEGILEDQGRDPVAYFRRKGVRESQVMRDARAIAASELPHDFANDGPHVVTGPVHVQGARPGSSRRRGGRESGVGRGARPSAASGRPHASAKDGPHAVPGPAHVGGPRRGDVLRVGVGGLAPRAPYGVISNRHGKGALPGE